MCKGVERVLGGMLDRWGKLAWRMVRSGWLKMGGRSIVKPKLAGSRREECRMI